MPPLPLSSPTCASLIGALRPLPDLKMYYNYCKLKAMKDEEAKKNSAKARRCLVAMSLCDTCFVGGSGTPVRRVCRFHAPKRDTEKVVLAAVTAVPLQQVAAAGNELREMRSEVPQEKPANGAAGSS